MNKITPVGGLRTFSAVVANVSSPKTRRSKKSRRNKRSRVKAAQVLEPVLRASWPSKPLRVTRRWSGSRASRPRHLKMVFRVIKRLRRRVSRRFKTRIVARRIKRILPKSRPRKIKLINYGYKKYIRPLKIFLRGLVDRRRGILKYSESATTTDLLIPAFSRKRGSLNYTSYRSQKSRIPGRTPSLHKNASSLSVLRRAWFTRSPAPQNRYSNMFYPKIELNKNTSTQLHPSNTHRSKGDAVKKRQLTKLHQINVSYWGQNRLKKRASQARSLSTYSDWESPSLFFVKGGKPHRKPDYLGINNSLAAVFINYLGPNGRCLEHTSGYPRSLNSSLNPQPLTRTTNLSSVFQNTLSQILSRNLGLDLLKKPLPPVHSTDQSPQPLRGPSFNLSTNLPVLSSSSLKSPLLTQWLFEHAFVQRRDIVAKGAVLVLSRVPGYKMDTVVPVNADRYRGNVYAKLGLQFLKPVSGLTQQPSSLVNLSTHLGHFNFISHISSNTRRPLTSKTEVVGSSWGSLSYLDESYLLRQNSFTSELFKLKYADQTKRSYKKMVLSHLPLNSKNLISLEKACIKPVFKLRLFKSLFDYNTSTKSTRSRKGRKPKLVITLRSNPLLLARYKQHTMTITKRRLRLEKFTWWKLKRLKNVYARLLKVRKRRRAVIDRTLADLPGRSQLTQFFAASPKPNTRQLAPWVGYAQTNVGSSYLSLGELKYSAHAVHSNEQLLLGFVLNNTLLKDFLFRSSTTSLINDSPLIGMWSKLEGFVGPTAFRSNLVPHSSFTKVASKKVLNSFSNKSFQLDLVPWYHNTLIRFIEECSGKKALFQFYPFINQEMGRDFSVRYRRWLPRMASYERSLGHRFFLEEALHIMHLSFILRDPKIIASWLKAMILRISFWRTRSIFRFLKYLFHNYFRHVFPDVGIKGLKIRLKGKISAAGNSRKRTILYRIGKTSHSQTSLRVLSEFTTINTFTGVMGFSVWLFY